MADGSSLCRHLVDPEDVLVENLHYRDMSTCLEAHDSSGSTKGTLQAFL